MNNEIREARAKGGRARQAKLDCARRRAARLILVTAPRDGWRNEWAAARGVKSRLTQFAKGRRLSLVCEDNLVRTIVRWIRGYGPCSRAYAATRRRS